MRGSVLLLASQVWSREYIAGLWTGWSAVRFGTVREIFLSSQWSGWVGGCFMGAKLPECETDHLPLTSTEAGNGESFTSAPVYVFVTCRLILSVHRADVVFQTSVAAVLKRLYT